MRRLNSGRWALTLEWACEGGAALAQAGASSGAGASRQGRCGAGRGAGSLGGRCRGEAQGNRKGCHGEGPAALLRGL